VPTLKPEMHINTGPRAKFNLGPTLFPSVQRFVNGIYIQRHACIALMMA